MPPDDIPTPQIPPQSPPGTADVFLSYAREDRHRAESIARALTEQRWSVWWDTNLVGGQRWQREIDRALDAARCVVVLWSHASVQSHWVLDEAGEGLQRGILVPVVVDDVEIPLGFRQVQTVNLAGAGEARDRELDDLIAGVARVLGRPKPEPSKPARMRRLLKAWGPAIAAALCVVAAIVLYIYPTGETAIDLEAKVSEVSFVSTRDQEITALMLVAGLDAAGLDSIGLPRARGRAEEILSASSGRGLAIRLAPGSIETRTGAITLPPVSVSQAARVTIARTDPRYRVSFSGSSIPVALNVQGPVLMTLAGTAPELVDFGAPKPVLLEPDHRGAQLEVALARETKPLLTSPLEIDALSLVRIDETVDTRRTAVSTVSTIISGTLQLEGLRAEGHTLGAGEMLRFGESHGEIRSLELVDGGLMMRFHGRVRRMESCTRGGCESRMPTHLEYFAARHRGWALAFAAVFLLCLVSAGRQLRRGW